MTKSSFTLLTCLFFNSLFGQTPVSGTINGEYWDLARSPFVVIGNITVIYLEIEPGVEVQFAADYDFNIDGFIKADGFYSDSIIFKPTINNPLGGWKSMKFRSGSSPASSLTYCRIEGALNHAIEVDRSSPKISNCSVVNNNDNGIFVKDTYLSVKNSIIRNNALDAISLDAGQISLSNSILAGNNGAGIVSSDNNDSISVVNCVIADNFSEGIDGGNADLIVKNSIIYYNGSGIVTSNPAADISYSNIQGSSVYPGTGNINDSPSFANRFNYILQQSSVSVDAGDPNPIYNDRYFPPSLGGDQNDMGAYGGPMANLWYPPLYLIPSDFNFGRVSKDSLMSTTLKIIGYRIPGVTDTSIAFTGLNSHVFSANQSNFYLNNLDTTDLIVSFQPDSELVYTADLVLGTILHGTVYTTFQGEGVTSEIIIQETELEFGAISLGDSLMKSIHLFNAGRDTLRIRVIPPNQNVFQARQLNFKMPPDFSNDSLQVVFKPTSPIIYADSLIIISNDPSQDTTIIPLSGEGRGPVFQASPTLLNFGSQQIFYDTLSILTLSNSGNEDLLINNYEITLQDSTAGNIEIADTLLVFPTVIETDSILELPLSFVPLKRDSTIGQIRLYSSDPFNQQIDIDLQGFGLAPEFSYSDTLLDFGRIPLYSDTVLSLTLYNIGDYDLLVFKDSLKISPSVPQIFWFDSLLQDLRIPPNDSGRITLYFSPQQLDTSTAQLEVVSSDPINPPALINLVGEGIGPQLAVTPSDTLLDFGRVSVPGDSVQILTLQNVGESLLIIDHDSLKISGTDSTDYTLPPNINQDIELNPGEFRELSVRFRPDSVGLRLADLSILCNDPENPRRIVSLTGIGFDKSSATIQYDSTNSTQKITLNQPATLSFSISSSSPVDSVFLYFRPGGQSGYRKNTLTSITQGIWSVTIDSTQVTDSGLEYYLQVYHGWTITEFPVFGAALPRGISVFIPEIGFPEATRGSVYQMISVPFSTAGQNLGDLFFNNLGPYNNTQYRFFDVDTNDEYIEIPNMDEVITPGKSLWLITKNSSELNIENGQTVETIQPFLLQLKSGWNMISTPFCFPVSWSEVSDTLPLRYYDGSDWPFASVLEPYKGYALYSDQEITLSIPAIEVPTTILLPRVNQVIASADWQIQLIARAGDLMDEYNYAGVLPEGSDGIDRYDFREPPPIGKYISLSLELDYSDPRYSTDFRSTGSAGYKFQFKVYGNTGDMREINLTPQNLPEEFDWTVVSLQTKIIYHKNIIQTSLPSSEFILLVGSPDFLNRNTSAYQEIPLIFNLQQNYPNPFNPETSIKFQIPESQRVLVKIYDILGRHVKTLIENEVKEAGYFELRWDGKNKSNIPVASGVYLLNLKSENYSKTIKMILQR